MTKLRLAPVLSEKPIKLSIEIPAVLYRDLKNYAEILAQGVNESDHDPAKLIIPMVAQFINGDKAFNKLKKSRLIRNKVLKGIQPP